jgi:hypothetical protein
MSGFPNHDSQPSFELWRQSILTQLNASLPALDGLAGAGAGSNPEKSPGSVLSEVKA